MNYTPTHLPLLPVHTKHGLHFAADSPEIHCYIVYNIQASKQEKCLEGETKANFRGTETGS